MKTTIKKAIFCIAIIAAAFASCKKNASDSSGLGLNGASASTNAALADCLPNATTITGNTVLLANFGNYAAWGNVPFTFPSSGPSINWEGQFNSFIRPTTTNWFVGEVNFADTCDTWATLRTKIVVKNVPANVGTDPTTGVSAGPYNVVGVNGATTMPPATYNLGYYLYNESTHVATVNKVVVIWKVTPTLGTWPTANTAANLASATAAYIINVKAINPIPVGSPPTSFYGSIPVKWKKVL